MRCVKLWPRQRGRLHACYTFTCVAALAAAAVLALHHEARAQIPQVEVIGVAPLPGQGVDRNLLPYDTQVLRREAVDRAHADNLGELMSRRLVGVNRSDIQGSPYQGDLTYRGYRASGLLGAGQGVSVYLDGVRINEAFGDVVNWELVPEFAIDSVSLVSGANPAFGLNTLGGAIAIRTLDGRTASGLRSDVTLGSSGRRRVDASIGGSSADGWHQYVAASGFAENGWREKSPSNIGLVLAKIGRSVGETDWTLGLLAGASRLTGNGLVPSYTLEDDGGEIMEEPDLYASRRRAVYTVSVQRIHLESGGAGGKDGVHQRQRWTPWSKPSPCADAGMASS